MIKWFKRKSTEAEDLKTEAHNLGQEAVKRSEKRAERVSKHADKTTKAVYDIRDDVAKKIYIATGQKL